MEKIIAIKTDHYETYIDTSVYYNEDDAAEDMFTAKGNRFTFNKYLWDAAIACLDDLASDDMSIMSDDSYDTQEDKESARIDVAHDYICQFVRNIKSDKYHDICDKITNETILKVIELANEYYNSNARDADTIASLLSLAIGIPFKTGYMYGCVQGEWCEYVCPQKMGKESLDYITAVIFGTGDEWDICTEDIEVDGKTTNKIAEEFYESGSHILEYTTLYNHKDVKEWIAKQASYGNKKYTADDVMLITTDGFRKVYNYKELS